MGAILTPFHTSDLHIYKFVFSFSILVCIGAFTQLTQSSWCKESVICKIFKDVFDVLTKLAGLHIPARGQFKGVP